MSLPNIGAIQAVSTDPSVLPNIGAVQTIPDPGAPPSGPTPQSASTNTAGTQLTVTFDEAVTETDATGWTFTADGTGNALTYVSGSGTTSLVYSVATTITAGQTLLLSYDDTTGNAVATGDATPVESFNDFPVTNNVPGGDGGHWYRRQAPQIATAGVIG